MLYNPIDAEKNLIHGELAKNVFENRAFLGVKKVAPNYFWIKINNF